MMQDYERVTELQEIAAQSAGATMAQMSTYMEGMEASLNKIRVAWEEIISGLTDNEALIGLLNTFGSLLDIVASITSSTFGMTAVLITLSAIGLTILGQKVNEAAIAKQQKQLALEQQKVELKTNKIIAEQYKASHLETVEEAKQLYLATVQKKVQAQMVLMDKDATADAIKQANATLDTVDNEIEKNRQT